MLFLIPKYLLNENLYMSQLENIRILRINETKNVERKFEQNIVLFVVVVVELVIGM